MAGDWVNYRGRVCWADFQYALDIARDAARRHGARYLVKGVHVPGRGWHWTVKAPGRRIADSPQA